ncbi:MAG: AMP-binding protein, partial [Alkalispirochaeta sp.]
MTANETVPKRLRLRAQEHTNNPFSWTKDDSGTFQPTTFGEMWETVRLIGGALLEKGVTRGEHVGIMSHNRREWIFTDLA